MLWNIRRFSGRIRSSASGGNMLLSGGPTYGVKSIRSKKKDLISISSISSIS
uniref:Ycf2 N-terminal domain-containing protein n=1 Tax=Nymphaea colorata TaxID=210225 RepID=A0A5K1HRV8_9MAGN|nr:unnamed protein product [Nymphaea colorata]